MITMGSVLPVGTIIHSMLSTTQFASEYGTNWVLADGRSVAGSLYAQVTGISSIPDMRGGFLRAKGATLNPDGDLALGTLTPYKDSSIIIVASSAGIVYDPGFPGGDFASGANETAPTSITVNVFIRIN